VSWTWLVYSFRSSKPRCNELRDRRDRSLLWFGQTFNRSHGLGRQNWKEQLARLCGLSHMRDTILYKKLTNIRAKAFQLSNLLWRHERCQELRNPIPSRESLGRRKHRRYQNIKLDRIFLQIRLLFQFVHILQQLWLKWCFEVDSGSFSAKCASLDAPSWYSSDWP